MKANEEPVVVEQTLAAPIESVWEAITQADKMRQWYFEPMAEFEPTVGFETEFDVEFEGEVYRHQWKIIEVVPEQKIAYEWRYGGHTGDSVVNWVLTESPDGTKITLSHSGQETFAQDNPAFSREAGIAGWSYLLQQSLKAFLDGSDS